MAYAGCYWPWLSVPKSRKASCMPYLFILQYNYYYLINSNPGRGLFCASYHVRYQLFAEKHKICSVVIARINEPELRRCCCSKLNTDVMSVLSILGCNIYIYFGFEANIWRRQNNYVFFGLLHYLVLFTSFGACTFIYYHE